MKRTSLLIAALTLSAISARAACDDQDPLPAGYGNAPAPAEKTPRPGCEPEGWFSSSAVKDAVTDAKAAAKQIGAKAQAGRKPAPKAGTFPYDDARALFISLGGKHSRPTIPFLRGEWILVGLTASDRFPEGTYNPEGLGTPPLQIRSFIDAGNHFLGEDRGVAAAGEGLWPDTKPEVGFNDDSAVFDSRSENASWLYECRLKDEAHLLCRKTITLIESKVVTVVEYKAYVKRK